MQIRYTNRKGITYYLCRGAGKTGKPRYYFAREPRDEPVSQIPEGFRISESVNGILSLAQDRPSQIWPEEVAAVEAAVRRHPKSGNYRVNVKRDRIEIYERVGPDAEELCAVLGLAGVDLPGLVDSIRATQERHGRFEPVLRLILADAEQRTFWVERMCYLGSVDDFVPIGASGTVDELSRQLIPILGTEDFFDLY